MSYPPIQIYNSLTRTKAVFEPRKPGHVDMYVCGVTVYNDSHLGHARMLVVFDVVVRYLRARGYTVRYVRNITDIDDKIINAAAEQGRTAADLAEQYTRVWEHEIARLGVLAPTITPRATGHILEMQELIAALIKRAALAERVLAFLIA